MAPTPDIQITDAMSCAQDSTLVLRSPQDVMRLEALGASFPHRLSFKRTLIRKLHEQKATLTITSKELDDEGFGHIVLTMPFCGRTYSLIGYSRALADEDRTDRVIATAWDASFCLFDGVPTDADIAYLSNEVTHQEAGIYHEKVMTLSRANKSVRLFSHVVDALSQGRQPKHDMIAKIGYLMRTTAVYGNGKFGIADRDRLTGYTGLTGPFQAEMLTVFLIREFTMLLVEHFAQVKGGKAAARLDTPVRRYIGVGNSTGLGMAPFLVNHPCLIHSWIMAREVALATARNVKAATPAQLSRFSILMSRAAAHVNQWEVDDPIQMARIAQLRKELEQQINLLRDQPLAVLKPFADAFDRVKTCSEEMQELMASLLIELIPEQIDGMADCMANPFTPQLYPSMRLSELSALVDTHYRWTNDIDLSSPSAQAHFWYVSEEKLEPRMGNRFDEDGAEREMPFNIPVYVADLRRALQSADDSLTVAEFLIYHPELRHIVRRVQTTARYPYGEIRDNLVDGDCRPIDLLRCKLSFFGASKFDPKSDRWTRITLYQGAPTAADLGYPDKKELDDWLFALNPA